MRKGLWRLAAAPAVAPRLRLYLFSVCAHAATHHHDDSVDTWRELDWASFVRYNVACEPAPTVVSSARQLLKAVVAATPTSVRRSILKASLSLLKEVNPPVLCYLHPASLPFPPHLAQCCCVCARRWTHLQC